MSFESIDLLLLYEKRRIGAIRREGLHRRAFRRILSARYRRGLHSKEGFNIYVFREDKYCLRGFSAPKSDNYVSIQSFSDQFFSKF